MHYNDVCHSPDYVGFDLIFDIFDYNQVLCGVAFDQLYLNTMQSVESTFYSYLGVLFFFITFTDFHLQTSLFSSSFFTYSLWKLLLKVRLLLDYSDLNKNLSNLHKIAILWSYCSHKFSPIPIKLLLLFVEIDHHIQYLWFMQLVGSFPWMICLKQVVSSHQKNVYHFNGLVDNSLCRPIKLILAKNDISYAIKRDIGLMLEKHLILHINNTGIFENRGVNIPISRWYEQWWYNS